MTVADVKTGLQLAYVSVVETEGKYAGGCLCVDRDGVPLEFRYTAPVAPTRMQELMYGGALLPQLKGRNIAETLLAGSNVGPSCVLTDDRDVYEGLQAHTRPVIWLARSQEEASAGAVEVGPGVWGIVRAPGGEQAGELIGSLRSLGERLSEPFERITRLLDELRQRNWTDAGG